jgi:hypothetical protein
MSPPFACADGFPANRGQKKSTKPVRAPSFLRIASPSIYRLISATRSPTEYAKNKQTIHRNAVFGVYQ